MSIDNEPPAVSAALLAEFGEIDIYLFDQLLRGRFDGRRRLLDAGCGTGRNLRFFLRCGFDVRAADVDPGLAGVDLGRVEAVEHARGASEQRQRRRRGLEAFGAVEPGVVDGSADGAGGRT